MSSYLLTVTEIENTAKAVNPDGRFFEGRHVDITIMANGSYPIITLYPFSTIDANDPDFIDSHQLIVGFWSPDNQGNNLQQRRDIIDSMGKLCSAFIAQLKTDKFVRVNNINREPQYLQYGGTLSGYAVRFTYMNFTPCP